LQVNKKMRSTFYTGFFKRFLDFLFAAIGLILVLPILCILFILLLITGHQKLIFTQKRIGYNEKSFLLYKICTMTDKRDKNGNLLPDSERLTVFGKFLRRTSLDELPQLINVILGQMSFIGPRPLLPEYLPRYSAIQRRRHDVRPGISGWAQVNGRNAISWEKKFDLDVYYVNHQSFLFDLKIIFLTVMKTLRSEGINQQGNATMEPFKGNQ
jgi:undecaprenyl phosphate N,N'-diacetylbacillosamine 1-phosphate transferase